MENFQVLDISKVLNNRIGLFTYRLCDPKNNFFTSLGCLNVLFSLTSFHVISSSMFMLKNVSQYLATSLYVIAGLQDIGMLVSVGLNMKKLKELHRLLQGIVAEGA